ncbi:E3 ubiquitin-protein ligase XIAP-like isoform X2 [Rhopalosiphum maidis]|uniref:E3 ubiquitin-protein ligase XIAP-like isoform X2 n=1 Tax=Rhopalosiphum maidis TaxID=43146 RepID=UPI000F00D5A8|nr:E3 ubiquitin-protein ligase XIAP-like isoform X2 [Rhopalosiphum maidis]
MLHLQYGTVKVNQQCRILVHMYIYIWLYGSSRFKAVPRTERNQRPVLPVKKIIEENIAIRRLVYLHTGRCTERLPNQDSPITDLCVVPAIHVSKDMSDPDHPVSKFIKYNRVINVCGLTNCGSDSTSKEKNKFMKFIRSTGIYLRETEWIYGGQELNSVEKRRKTFERCNVMSPENINKLCEAGFYYIGDGKTEETMCFCCGKRVLYWGKSVKPWTTHAIITKDCYYMALCKGKYYVHQVYNDYQHIQSYCKTNFFEQLINIKYDENSFNEILSAPNYSDSEDESFSEVQSSKKIRRQPLTERLLTTVTINNTTEPILLCKICAKDIISVLIIPCGHVIACIQCALTLKDCPACTLLFDNETVFLRVFIVKTDKNIKRVNDYLKTDTNYVENPEIDQSLCKVCQKNDLVAYVPCRHIYSCSECTLTLNNSCPICNVGLIGMIQISLT